MLAVILNSRVQCVAVVILLVLHSLTAQYDSHYKVRDDEESDEDEPQTDYTKYFSDDINTGGVVRAAGGGAPPPNPDSSGFVQPLDFTGFFAGGHFGLGPLSDGTTNHAIFRHSGSSGHFPDAAGFGSNLESSASNNNNTYGFVNPNINFRSLFDTTVSASDTGFRPQDFVQKSETKASPVTHNDFFTPAFASLKEDVDKGVKEQQREEAIALSSKSSGKRYPTNDEYDDEAEGGGDYSYDESDDSYLDPNDRKPQKFSSINPYHVAKNNGQQPSYRTPYGEVKTSARTEPRPTRPTRPVHQAQSSPEPDYGYASPFQYPKKYDYDDDIPFTSEPRLANPINAQPHKPRNNKPLHQAHYSGTYNKKHVRVPPPQARDNPGKAAYRPDHRSKLYTPTHVKQQEYNQYSNPSNDQYKPHSDFRPSPSDSYLDGLSRPDIESALNPPHHRPSPVSTSDGLRSLPQTEYASVIPKNIKSQVNDQNGFKGKVCTKIHKKINPEDVSAERFKRQHMTCYVCNEPKTGRKYEECTYESIPSGKTYYKGNKESYISDTNVKPYKYHTRSKRFASNPNPFESGFLKGYDFSYAQSLPLIRKVRQYSNYDDSSHYGHDDSNYRFGPEYFTDDGVVEEDESDSPQENESCKKVKKDGLICMVCKNLKTAGTYEQCSYASDPEENRYSYGTQKVYGSQRPSDGDRYKRRVDEAKDEQRKLKKNSIKNKYKQNENIEDLKRKGDFKYGKLKRKKVGKEDYDIPLQFSESVAKREKVLKDSRKKGAIGLDPEFYGSPDAPYRPDSKEKNNKTKIEDKGLEGAATSVENDEEDEKQDDDDTLTYEDYFFKLFPELAGGKGDKNEEESKDDDYYGPTEDEEEEETKNSNTKVEPAFEYAASLPDYFDDTENKKDLEKVLGEFSQKDRTDCKKVMRDKMTCYQCIDKKGMQHEECMFVAASEPKSKHLAYHEVKEFRITPEGKKEEVNKEKLEQTNPITFETVDNVKSISPPVGEKKTVKPNKRPNGKKYNDSTKQSTVQPVATATDNLGQSAEIHDFLKLKPKYESKVTVDVNKLNEKLASEISQRVLNRKKRLPVNVAVGSEENVDAERKQDVRKPYNSVPPEPESFDAPEGPEGAYSHETEPVFDSVLKISLPKYMLQRSEHEAIFDEVLASG